MIDVYFLRGDQRIDIMKPDGNLLDHAIVNGFVSQDASQWNKLHDLCKRVPRNHYCFYWRGALFTPPSPKMEMEFSTP